MTKSTMRALTLVALAGGVFFSSTAFAQNPEDGDIWVPPAQQQQQPVQQQPVQQQPVQQQPYYQQPVQQPQQQVAETPPPVQAQNTDSGDQSDHQRFVGNVAIGYQGLTNVPIGGSDDGMTAANVGFRYWVSEMIGVDAGIGLGFGGGSTNGDPLNSAFGLTLHGAIPLALYNDAHYKFLVIPEMNLGFSTGTIYGADRMGNDDRGASGFLFEVGARAGTEIHFGFIGVPQLSVQATVGIHFRYASVAVSDSVNAPGSDTSGNAWNFGTSVEGEPWDIFLGSLNALYYIE